MPRNLNGRPGQRSLKAIAKRGGYNGNTLLKKTNIAREWTREEIAEYLHCSQDPVYFIEKYMRIININKGLVNFIMYPYQKDMIKSFHNNRYTIVTTARQSGKALALDTPIATPTGYKTIADIVPGDYVFSEFGNPIAVTAISPIFENHDCYRLTFDDNTTIDCNGDHLWTYNVRDNRHKQETKTAAELYKSTYISKTSTNHNRHRYYILNAGPLNYPTQPVDLDPYVLGLWLGDGTSASGGFTCTFNDLMEYKTNIPYEFKDDHTFQGTIYKIVDKLKHYNMINNKHIPDQYMFNDIPTRIALLQGLMDTDGWVDSRGGQHIQLANKNTRLISDVNKLVCSLGGKVFVKKFNKTNSTILSFNIARDQFDVFRLSRKREKQISTHNKPLFVNSRSIINIEKISSVLTKCLVVDNQTHLFLCGHQNVPTHNSTVTCGYILWYILFNPDKTVALLANKGDTAREIVGKVQLAYQHLPHWLQQGVRVWNKGSFELENNSRVVATSTSSDAIRGYSINLLFIDEAAFIDNWDSFFTSVYPTITSGDQTKVVLVSTPNGLNHFYSIWENARAGKNQYNPIEVRYDKVPGRNDKWREDTLAAMNFDTEKFEQEYCCEFMGSSGTLIAGWKLKQLVYKKPLVSADGLNQYIHPIDGHKYAIVCDVSRGKGQDYSAFQVIDVTKMPWVQVCIFNNNQITPMNYAEIIHRVATVYNQAHVLVEINDIGEQVSNIIFYDFGYENILFTDNAGRSGKRVTAGFGSGSSAADKGIRTTKVVKNVGCSLLKLLVEQNQLIINDFDTINELATFSKKGTSYEAETGKHDDLVMALVLFAWLSDQAYFKEITNINTLSYLRDKTLEQIDEDMSPFGFINIGDQDIQAAKDLINPNAWLIDDYYIQKQIEKQREIFDRDDYGYLDF